MVRFIKRDKNDIFGKKILGFLFHNQKFLKVFKSIVLFLFLYAIYYGFTHTGKDNLFTPALFWGIFWSFFMVLTLPSLGRIFCGICPHGFLGKYVTRFGLQKTMPKWMQNRFIGIFILVVGWWGVYYAFPGIYRTPWGTAMMFTVMTVVAMLFYFVYKDMSYCKYICPIGTLTRAYSKLSFTWLGTYKSACSECRTFECATACPYDLKPFTFDNKNSMGDCTLCMDCSAACEAVSFKVTKPSFSLFGRMRKEKAEVWAYILILASIPIAMAFHHGLGRSKIADHMIWARTAEVFKPYLGSVDAVGLFAWLYALFFTILAAVVGMYIAAKILNKSFKDTFYDLGYAYAPLFIFASMGHALSTFFTRGYERIVEGFAQAFGFAVDVEPLANRGDEWLRIFDVFRWIAIIWAAVILYKRLKRMDAPKTKKILAFPFAASLILFYFGVNQYRDYVIDTYGRASRGMHGMHNMRSMGGAMFQRVSPDKATILQKGPNASSCIVCGMKLPMFFKTNHAATLDGAPRQYCSIHCLAEELRVKKLPLKDLKVVDTDTLKFIDARSAWYVIGSKKPGTMTRVSKYAFGSKAAAQKFAKANGGRVGDFQQALRAAMRDFKGGAVVVKPTDTVFFTDRNPMARRGHMGGMHSMGGSHNASEVPTRSLYLVTKDIKRPKCVKNSDEGTFLLTDVNGQEVTPKISRKKGCAKITFEVPDNGYYTAYYLYQKPGALTMAKYEYKRFNHSSDEKFTPEKIALHPLKKLPFDILRYRDGEDSFYKRFTAGETLRFRVLKAGEPVKGARVTLKTQLGWQKSVRTDEEGIAKIMLIQDYLPPAEKFNRRYREKFLVTARYKDEMGQYKISYAGTYSPSRDSYQSYKYGLIVFLLLLIVISGAVFLYRMRVQKPFKEVTFDE